MKTAEDHFLENVAMTYEWLAGLLLGIDRKKYAEEVLCCAQSLALFATEHHPGRFADGRIENVVLEIGRNLVCSPMLPGTLRLKRLKACQKRRILHVATTVYFVGGHTRNLHKWILKDPESAHSVAVTQQGVGKVPAWLAEATDQSGGECVVFPSGLSMLEKAQRLRLTAQSGFDFIILHHHFHDVIPTAAFAVPDCPPVAMRNHSDQIFGTGSGVIDLGINSREPVPFFNETRRYIQNNLPLPHPLIDDPGGFSRGEARAQLQLEDNAVMLLTSGSPLKYLPTGKQNFFLTVQKILEANPNAVLFVIGVSWEHYAAQFKGRKHPRIHFTGSLEDTSVYQRAADIFMESFTFGSQSALLESVLQGAVPVLAYDPPSPFLCVYAKSLRGRILNPQNEQDYMGRVNDLIRDEPKRKTLAAALQKDIFSVHAGEGWQEYLRSIYRFLESKSHAPHAIPFAEFCKGPLDRAVSDFYRLLYPPSHFYYAAGAGNLCRYPGYGLRPLLAIWCRIMRLETGSLKDRFYTSLSVIKNLFQVRMAADSHLPRAAR